MSIRTLSLLSLASLLFTLSCNEEPAEREGDDAGECGDDADNDFNGLFDCADPACAAAPSCQGDDDTAAGDDDSSTGDDDTATGDDDTATGDDDTAAGDDDSSTGDDDTATGDDDTATGDDDTATGDDDTATGDDDDDEEIPCVDPGFSSSDPCCSLITKPPGAGQCADQTAFASVCAADDFCCLEEWEPCCVEQYANDFGANCQ